MNTAWFHCFAGTAGDMTLGALVDAGADAAAVAAIVGGVDLDGYALSFERVQRCGLMATHAIVATYDDHAPHDHHDDDQHDHATQDQQHDHQHDDQPGHHHHHRPYREIRDLMEAADLPARVRERALATFQVLAEVEGAMHGADPLDVEFHEVGSVDAIVDIVGTCAALEVLAVDRVVCSPIAVSRGTAHSAHGEIPTPAPAVAALLARRGVPAFGIDTRKEIATPTGVALMVALADEFAPMPAMTVRAAGYGAGTADTPGRPNVVQVVIGQEQSSAPMGGQPVRLLEANVDDATGEVVAHTIAALLEAGAHDAWATPIVMKKGRPAQTVSALCDVARTADVAAVLVAETGSLGVRGAIIERWPQRRDEATVDLEGHAIRVKLAAGRVKVEHDDAAAAARALGWPLRAVLSAAEALGWASQGGRRI